MRTTAEGMAWSLARGKARSRRRCAVPGRGGFTLIEISMVLLLFASAIGGLLSFFPVGLKLESNAMSDSVQTMFSLDILGQAEANVASIDDWGVWTDTQAFIRQAFADISVNGKQVVKPANFKREGSGKKECWRTSELEASGVFTRRDNLTFVVQCTPVPTPIYFGGDNAYVRRISIWVNDRQGGDPYLNTPFVRDFAFRGDFMANLANQEVK